MSSGLGIRRRPVFIFRRKLIGLYFFLGGMVLLQLLDTCSLAEAEPFCLRPFCFGVSPQRERVLTTAQGRGTAEAEPSKTEPLRKQANTQNEAHGVAQCMLLQHRSTSEQGSTSAEHLRAQVEP